MTWRERIAEARARGYSTVEDRALALRWCTCAVGEQRKLYGAKIVRYGVGVTGRDWDVEHCGLLGPKDWGLQQPGAEFAGAIRRNDFDEAERLLEKIEDRVLQLKREAQP